MNIILTQDPQFLLRFATPDDAGLVVSLMQKLGASRKKMAGKITATEQDIRRLLADKKGEAVFGIYAGQTVGLVYFYQASSAFTGQSRLHIDGFLIEETLRFKGPGKVMIAFMARLALDRGCQQLEWGCLDWNKPTARFSKRLGAHSVDTLTLYQIAPDQLKASAAQF